MVFFPDCKINLGLDILRRRDDGYHDIETVMLPVRGLCDILEIVPSDGHGVEFSSTGLPVDCRTEDNLCVKAYKAVDALCNIGGVKIHLHKIIPFGAGLGGGSADAAFTIKGLSQLFSLGLDSDTLKGLAAGLGSDAVFFIDDKPSLSAGRGEQLYPVGVPDITGMELVIVKPPFGVSTAAAYSMAKPSIPEVPLRERISVPVGRWREVLKNDFEESVFSAHPVLGEIKGKLYGMGAVYASLSGSGSAMFGLFDGGGTMDKQCPDRVDKRLREAFSDCFIHGEAIGRVGQ